MIFVIFGINYAFYKYNRIQCHKVWQNYTIQIKEHKGNEIIKKKNTKEKNTIFVSKERYVERLMEIMDCLSVVIGRYYNI